MIQTNFQSYGLHIYNEFISSEEEREIVSKLDHDHNNVIQHKGCVRSSIKRYGSSVPYKNQIVSDLIPPHLDRICTKLVEQKLLDQKPDSVSINTYYPGNGIAAHIDSLESGPTISILSLLADATMVFTKDSQIFSVLVPKRSLLQLKDQIRYDWEHAILPVKDKRYSVVFRLGK